MKQLIFLTLTLFAAFQAFAKVELPAIVSSNMVLQRNTTVHLWGWADKNEKLQLSLSWIPDAVSLKADKTGKWTTTVETNASKAPQQITISTKDTSIVLENILFGEVWLCSGQSNMEMPLNGYTGQPVLGALQAIVQANNPHLRLFHVERKGSRTPQNDIEKYAPWQQASPDNVPEFSAVAYFFGQQLQKTLDVPVGLIHTSWGGSKIQAWMPAESVMPLEPFDLDTFTFKRAINSIPSALYNSMIYPLIPYTIKGAIWYQGESNRDNPFLYEKLFPTMVEDWRTKWNQGEFPFYYVQIAPYHYRNREAFDTIANTAYLREAQLKCVDSIPNSGMAVTMDIGEEGNIHPAHKKEVADRLLYQALNKTYHFTNLDCDGPTFKSIEVKDGGIYLEFNNAENGLYAPTGLDGFVIAGADKVFYPATAKLKSRTKVFVKSKHVPNPVAVRYGWSNWVVGTLFDTNNLPASSFKTDTWNDATLQKDVN